MSIWKRIEELGKRIVDKLGKNSLTPLERWEKIRRFEEADRVTGSFAFWSPAGVGIQDISTREYYTNPEKMYFCQLLALERFCHDYPILIADNYNTEPEALGAKIAFAGDDTPVIVEPSLRDKEDLSQRDVPDPSKDGRLPYRIEICRIHKEVLGKYFPTLPSINAPFSMAVGMRGYESLIVDMVEDQDFVHELLEFCTRAIIVFGKAIKSACGVYPSISDAWSSIPNLSPEMFFEFSFPYATRCLEVFEHSGWSFGGGHQFANDWKRSLRRILASGVKSLNLFEENITGIRGGKTVDLKEIKGFCQKRKIFLNTAIHPDNILNGPASKIEDLVHRLAETAASGGGQAFYTSILMGTPFEHIDAYVKAIKRTTFPISSSKLSS